MVERTFNERLRAGLTIFLEQVAFKAAGIDPDADGAAIGSRGGNNFGNALCRPDIARIDPKAGCPRIGRLERALIVKMNVGDDRHLGGADDLTQGGGAFLVGAGNADDVGSGLLAAADLGDRRGSVGGQGVGHRLDSDRRIAADGDVTDHDLARLAALNRAPGAKRGHTAHIEVRSGKGNWQTLPMSAGKV